MLLTNKTQKNRTFSTQNTKILARSFSISYICFQVGNVKKGHVQKGQRSITEKLMTPHPSPPTRALYAKFQWEKLQILSLLHDDHLEGPYIFAENSIASGCSAPWAPGRGSAPRPHPYGARGALVRMETFPPAPPPPPFWKSWIRHCYSMSGKLTQKC